MGSAAALAFAEKFKQADPGIELQLHETATSRQLRRLVGEVLERIERRTG
jgi:hypothetical protein